MLNIFFFRKKKRGNQITDKTVRKVKNFEHLIKNL